MKRASPNRNKNDLLRKQIFTLGQQIDELVYELYDLTPEEIAIVEGAASN